MKQTLTLLLWLCLPFLSLAQNPLTRVYEYDAAGNRVVRKLITLKVPSTPAEDSVEVTSDELLVTSYIYFVEKLAQLEMKINPNPSTEKITLSIINMNKLQSGLLQLYSMNGQLLQTQPIHSATSEISLVGFVTGSYILKVQINDTIENWKIIKQ
ncbi:MAG: T9SS type A sorting domain-containing protein [Bacteroidales bacterium]|nr:T9SS type A sorting domain-containing protein [Bacteroidales bacterium]